jgi:LPS-assembly lipoprotein
MQFAETPADASAVLSIHLDRTDQRVLSVSARNVPTEYEVYYSVQYSIDNGDENLLNRQFLTVTRAYTYDETLVLGKTREEDLLREAIVNDLVRIVMKQLGTL